MVKSKLTKRLFKLYALNVLAIFHYGIKNFEKNKISIAIFQGIVFKSDILID